MRLPLRVLRTAAWLVPAAVLVLSGVAKVVDPEGAVPRSLLRVVDLVPYSLLLRALGLFELVVAGLLAFPRSRPTAALAALGLFAAFSWLAASNAADQEFLANCGCFGGLAEGAAIGPLRGLGAVLVRNAALCGLLAAFLHGTAREWAPWWRSLAVGAAAAALVFFAGGYVGAGRLAAEDARVQEALRGARRLFPGLPLPDIALVAPDGARTTSRLALRDGDHALFFSPSCPHCRAMAPSFAGFARDVAARGGRLVLLAVTAPAEVTEFKRTFACEDVPHFSVPERIDPFRWGVDSVPALVVVGPSGRLRKHQSLPASATFSESLAVADTRVAGLAAAVWRRLADRLVGEGSQVGPSRRAGSFQIAEARTASGEPVRMCVATIRGNPPYTMELALCVDATGTLRGGVVPLTLAGYASAVDPAGAFLSAFDGRTLADAAREAERRAGEPSMLSPLFESAALVFGSLADELAPPPAPVPR
jgi:thiol-disulfide isomerase/thioredoxin